MLAESLPNPRIVLSVGLQSNSECFPTIPEGIRNFGIVLEPRYIVGTGRLDQ